MSSTLINNKEEQRFEKNVDGYTAYVAYEMQGNTIFLTHTIVPPEIEGRGVGGFLVKDVLNELEDTTYKVIPTCSFIVDFIERNPRYLNLVERP